MAVQPFATYGGAGPGERTDPPIVFTNACATFAWSYNRCHYLPSN